MRLLEHSGYWEIHDIPVFRRAPSGGKEIADVLMNYLPGSGYKGCNSKVRFKDGSEAFVPMELVVA